mmetsp:Transcript_1896/g.5201  ORF Transcript_1896/g.5201 Transcript_1896/m.5201 type:complete len:214 (+) Transcript_1896:602-1243(+)
MARRNAVALAQGRRAGRVAQALYHDAEQYETAAQEAGQEYLVFTVGSARATAIDHRQAIAATTAATTTSVPTSGDDTAILSLRQDDGGVHDGSRYRDAHGSVVESFGSDDIVSTAHGPLARSRSDGHVDSSHGHGGDWSSLGRGIESIQNDWHCGYQSDISFGGQCHQTPTLGTSGARQGCPHCRIGTSFGAVQATRRGRTTPASRSVVSSLL